MSASTLSSGKENAVHRPIARYAAVPAAALTCLAATAGGTALAGARAPAAHRAATAATTTADRHDDTPPPRPRAAWC